jgi:hypothetical protein
MLRVGRFSLESRFWWERFGKTLALLSRTGAGIFVEEQTESYVLVLIMQWPATTYFGHFRTLYPKTHTHVMYV